VADNVDLGRPEHVEVLVERSPRGRKPKDPAGGAFKTAIDRNNNGVTINAFWQDFPGQAVPQRRPGTADRDRRELTR
jgi:hypothetical protein